MVRGDCSSGSGGGWGIELGIGDWDGKDDVAALGHRDSATVVTAL